LAAKLKRLDLNVDLVKEVARDCPLPINRDTTLDAQQWILHTQCAREIAAQRSDAIVCDRSVLDNYAYFVHALGRQRDLDPWIQRWCKTYARLFKVPVWKQPSFDGTRDTDVAFQLQIDETLDALISDLEIDVVRLDPQTPERWIEEILRELGLPLEPPQSASGL
jgi:hypothetical protein